MLRTVLFFLAAALAANATADGSRSHFNQALATAQTMLGDTVAPRMVYIPHAVMNAGNPAQAIVNLCTTVAESLRSLQSEIDNLAVASVDDKAQMKLLKCIDEALGGTRLPKLRLAFVGSKHCEPQARAIVEAWGAAFYFAPDTERTNDGWWCREQSLSNVLRTPDGLVVRDA